VPEVISVLVEVLVAGKGTFATFWRRDKSIGSVMVHGLEIWTLLI
jgi:hypothetical protein